MIQVVAQYPGAVMAQYPGGAPVAVSIQGGSGMVPVQTVTPGPQRGPPQMVVVPVSGMVITTPGAKTTGFQPQFAQVATSGAMAATYQPEVPPTYGHGGYTKLENDDVRVIFQTFFI